MFPLIGNELELHCPLPLPLLLGAAAAPAGACRGTADRRTCIAGGGGALLLLLLLLLPLPAFWSLRHCAGIWKVPCQMPLCAACAASSNGM